MSAALRWEAAGAAGGLFPVLDAGVRLSGDGDGSRVTLAGSCRPPLSVFGERLAGLSCTWSPPRRSRPCWPGWPPR